MRKCTDSNAATNNALLRRLVRACEGATAIEYALIAAGIGLAIVVSVQALGVTLNATYVSFGGLF